MSNYNYDQLPAIHESQDIAEYVDLAFTPTQNSYDSQRTLGQQSTQSTPSLPEYTPLYERERADLHTRKSFDTLASSSSTGSNIEKLKNGWNRLRRKPVGGSNSFQGSVRRHPAADVEPTRIGRGVWEDQLLIDRSLRGMAALTALLAFAMFIVIVTHIKPFQNRPNKNTTSIGGEARSCKDVTMTNTALLLLINVAATCILGMSNTYQQLVTSLTIGDLKHMLQKYGDSRVGTNSPFNINHKKEGKRKSWLAWLLLITTSLPVHFLANSLIGPSMIVEPPRTVQYNATTWDNISNNYRNDIFPTEADEISNTQSYLCWSAFRTGVAHFPASLTVLSDDTSSYSSNSYSNSLGNAYARIVVQYAKENCSSFVNSTSDATMVEASRRSRGNYYYETFFEDGCAMGTAVKCGLFEIQPTKCRLNVRMNAAFVLFGCLTIKAIYMIAVNLLARGKLKRHCLTFGDVIVASSSDPDLRVQGECMVNASDNVRRQTTHTCHKHCKSRDESKTGDEIGHCQKCKKWNNHNKHAQLPQPTIATKFKKSLISNLGNTALTQMLLLMFCSFVLLGVSAFVAVMVGITRQSELYSCKEYPGRNTFCNMSTSAQLNEVSGGWGGFNQSLSVASLAPDSLNNEMMSFAIANGAQFIYSLLYLMMIYNITLCSQEYSWGRLEHERRRPRCTIVKGESFSQDYLLQLPKKILFPLMAYSVLAHWMLGEALQIQEAIWLDTSGGRHIEHSQYNITYAAYPLWAATFLLILMTGICWWAYTYKREGFVPQMFGSIRTLCAATSSLDDFPSYGIQWGDLGMNKQFRHAGLTAEVPGKIVPNELYAGLDLDVDGEAGSMKGETEPLLHKSRWEEKDKDDDLFD